MDDRVKKAIEFANYRISLFNIKENIKIKVDGMLTYAVNGGLFRATPELITFTKLIIETGEPNAVMIDVNGNPIEITDLEGFYSELLDRYFQATNYYHVEYSKLKKARSIRDQIKEVFEEEV